MFPTQLRSYADAEASTMGLERVVNVTLNPQLDSGGLYSPNPYYHDIQLKEPTKSNLEHELGHAYIEEKFPMLRKFFIIAGAPYRASQALGSIFSGVYILATLAVGVTGYFIHSPVLQLVPLTNGPWITEELMAHYFGRKYRPNVKAESC